MKKDKKQLEKGSLGKKITRKEAIKKAGITALAASSFMLLQTKSHACTSRATTYTTTNTTYTTTWDNDWWSNFWKKIFG